MGNDEFLELCKDIVAKLYKEAGKEVTEDNIFISWSTKVLQNNKALVSTTQKDGMYYEITHNGNTKEIYVDVYKKQENIVVKVDEVKGA